MRLLAPSRGTHTYWTDKDPVIFEGVIGLTKDRLFPGSLEYFVGDGTHKYSELHKYGGAEASILSKAYTLVLRNGEGKIELASSDLPDATPTSKGAVKASVIKAGDNVVKADADGNLNGWKDAISDAVANPNAGLIKNADGTLGVDFDNMPTDKFEVLLKSLKMLIPLSANMDLYVDTNNSNAGDNIVDGRGTQNLPFKTIQAAVNFVTSNYNVGRYTVTIYVATGNYNEEVTLPTYSRTSGSIILTALDLANPPTLYNTQTSDNSHGIVVTGSVWYIRRINIVTTFSDSNNGLSHVGVGIEVSGSSAVAYIQSCSVSCTFTGTSTANNYNVRVVSVNNGATCRFSPISGYASSFSVNGSAPYADILAVYTNGTIDMPSLNYENDDIGLINYCNGTGSNFARVYTGSKLIRTGGGMNFQTFAGSFTGKKYTIHTSSYIVGPAPANLPGDTDGTADSESFSYYRVG